MDFNGNGVLIEQDRLHLAMDIRPEQFNMDQFRYICILSGCDYLPSLPGIGLGKARKFITRNTDQNIHRALTRVGTVLNMNSLVVTQEYRDAFILADITFKHQLVFCPLQRKQVRLNPPTADVTEDQLHYAGKELDVDLALQLALGNCDPSTLKMVHDFNPDKIERKRKRDVGGQTIYTSIWSSEYKLKTKDRTLLPRNTLNSFIANKELALKKYPLNGGRVSSELQNSPTTVSRNELSKSQDSDKNEILDMYNSNRDAKPIASPERKAEENVCFMEDNTSPELFKPRNPFVKQISNLTTSPSVLSDGNCRRRGKNLMRIRRTIVDENVLVKSKYFSKQDDEKRDVFELENKKVEDVEWKDTKCNIIPETCTYVYDARVNQEQLEALSISTANRPEIANLITETNDALLSDQRDLTDTCEVVYETSYSNYSETEALHNTIDKDYILDHFLSSSKSNTRDANDSLNYGNASGLRDNLSKWSNIKGSAKKKMINKQSSASPISRVNSVTKRRQSHSKQLSVAPRQSLLSMYGFQKRANLEH